MRENSNFTRLKNTLLKNSKAKSWENAKDEWELKYCYISEDNCTCGHEFESILCNILKGVWCSYCCNPPQKLCDKEDCSKCFEKSFASHEKSQYWNQKNKLKPREVFKSSSKSPQLAGIFLLHY